MGMVIVITSGKGGVGKTTIASNLGVGLAVLGKRVILIDADIGLRNLDLFLSMERKITYDIYDVINGECELRKAFIVDKKFDGLFLLPGSFNGSHSQISPTKMMRIYNLLKIDFDYVIVDCPSGIDSGFRNVIVGADRSLVVITTELTSVRNAEKIIKILNNKGNNAVNLIINRVRDDHAQKGLTLNIKDISKILDVDIIGIIPEDDNVIAANQLGRPIISKYKSLVMHLET